MKQEEDQIRIIIRNDGPPIEEHMLSNLYEPFSKGKRANSVLD